MIHHVWSVLCERSFLNKETNNLSLIEAVEQINVALPVAAAEATKEVAVSLELTSLWSRADLAVGAFGHARLVVWTASGARRIGSETLIDLREYRRWRMRSTMTSFPVSGPGLHWMAYELKLSDEETWREVTRLPVEVVFLPSDIT